MKIPDKIKAMTKGKRRKWVKAIDEMYRAYKKNKSPKDCPFYDIVKERCEDCIWIFFENIDCLDFAKERKLARLGVPEPQCSDDDFEGWVKVRLPMLRKWRRMLVEAGI